MMLKNDKQGRPEKQEFESMIQNEDEEKANNSKLFSFRDNFGVDPV